MEIDKIYYEWINRSNPTYNYKMAGDLPERLDFIYNYFSDKGIKTILELGTYQGCSTAAWIKLQPEILVCVDIIKNLDVNRYALASKELNVNFKFIVEDDLKFMPINCDLLFVDTVHEASHTYKELMRYGTFVAKYIVFHDINRDHFTTQDGIDKWAESTNEWRQEYLNINIEKPLPEGIKNCGLSIWKRKI